MDSLLLEQVAQTGAEEIVIVHEEDANVSLLGSGDLGCLGHLAAKSRKTQWMVMTTVLRPQRMASAVVGNQRSIIAPRTPLPVSAATASP